MRELVVRDLGVDTAYGDVLRAMRVFTDDREADTPDELWLTEHQPVFTQGQAGRAEFVIAPGDIPVVPSDRGGQITYHGPGQLVAYLLFDLRRLGLSIRALVRGIENAIVQVLATYGVCGQTRAGAPGVYAGPYKIAALGLRVRRGCSYHGLSLNVDMALGPYAGIVPCGLAGTGVTTLRAIAGPCSVADVAPKVVQALAAEYGFESFAKAPPPAAFTSQRPTTGGFR